MLNSAKCIGRGDCLQRTEDGRGYEASYRCRYDCETVQCPNYVVCAAAVPRWMLDVHGGACQDCALNYGCVPLVTVYHDPMMGCLKCCNPVGMTVKMPSCDHSFCLACFRYAHSPRVKTSTYVSGAFECPTCETGRVPCWDSESRRLASNRSGADVTTFKKKAHKKAKREPRIGVKTPRDNVAL
jgi:hypothetical protein